jgi:hypothetical protein
MATRLIPFQEGMKVGFGYDLITGSALSSPAVQGKISTINDAKGQTVTSGVVRIDDIDTLHQSLGVNVDAGGSYFGASIDVKVNYAKECNVATQATHLLVAVSVRNAFESFDDPVLTQDASELMATMNSERFRERFGDVFIEGILRGGEYFATYEIISIDESSREKVAVAVEASFNSGLAAAHLNSDIETETSKTDTHTEVRTHVFQKGAIDPTDQSFAAIMNKAKDFPPSVAGDLAAPFAVSLADYRTLKLPTDGFDFLQIQNQRDVLTEHAKKRFMFLKLLNDISYIRQHPGDFIGVDHDNLGKQFAQVTDNINVMEKEASACLRDAKSCSFTPFDVSDFPLPPPTKRVRVRDFTGTDSGTAQDELAALGISDIVVDLVESDIEHRGLVISQSPAPGLHSQKETITLSVGFHTLLHLP